MSDQRYMLRGVSASKEDVHNAIKNVDKGLYPKAFCKIINKAKQYPCYSYNFFKLIFKLCIAKSKGIFKYLNFFLYFISVIFIAFVNFSTFAS